MARHDYGFITVDFTRLRVVKDAYSLPRVNDTLDELKDANFNTYLDLVFGFWQVREREEDIHKTKFQTHDDLMEWVAMSFGQCNASATFQRMMTSRVNFYTSPLISTSTTFVSTVARWTNTWSTCVLCFNDSNRKA
jgi:hypothetical protein